MNGRFERNFTMEIYIFRHGQTAWNTIHRLQGSTDIPLNENGVELAKISGANINHIHFDKIFSSPLCRALDTAHYLANGRDIPIVTNDLLREINFGAWEGLTDKELIAMDAAFKYFFDQPSLFTPAEGGETFEEVGLRAKTFLTDVIEPLEHTHNRIMIVAHGAINKGLFMHIDGHGPEDFWKGGLHKNCGASIVDYTAGKYSILEDNIVFY